MAEIQRVPAAQQLRDVAKKQENDLLVKNAFQDGSSEYSANAVPTEIDGAMQERTRLNVMNMFNESTPYKNPEGENI